MLFHTEIKPSPGLKGFEWKIPIGSVSSSKSESDLCTERLCVKIFQAVCGVFMTSSDLLMMHIKGEKARELFCHIDGFCQSFKRL